ncbi:MAG: methyltransferase domain-containing protein [Actinomycetota bacterium]|nr:methyltransferase domain-containing protein [Actinomycetota bacterium]
MRKQLEQKLGRRLARLATNAVVRRPLLWRAFRWLLRLQFDRLAPRWDTMRDPAHLNSFELALEGVEGSPRRALDLGTGTGAAAFAVARRFPEAQVTGADLSAEMLVEARRKTPPELAERVRFEQADAARLPYGDASFELVTLANMIPFFDELARVLSPGGRALFSFSVGPETPIWVPPERLRAELSRRGFSDFADFQAGSGTALLARKRERV